MGENAGVVDIGDGWAVTFKVESHNHPSYVEPYQGAATGVGRHRARHHLDGRPPRCRDGSAALRRDRPPRHRTRGARRGLREWAATATPWACRTSAAKPSSTAAYQANPLVNALAVGVMRHEDIRLAQRHRPGNKVVLFGARTGGDGIGGASILASETRSSDGGPTKRPACRWATPSWRRSSSSAASSCTPASSSRAIQDLGAAGISCATSELAANGGSGMHVELTNVLLRDSTLTAGEILMSESQERMMAMVTPEKLAAFQAVVDKWDVETSRARRGHGRRPPRHRRGRRHASSTWTPRPSRSTAPSTTAPTRDPHWHDTLQADSREACARRQPPRSSQHAAYADRHPEPGRQGLDHRTSTTATSAATPRSPCPTTPG